MYRSLDLVSKSGGRLSTVSAPSSASTAHVRIVCGSGGGRDPSVTCTAGCNAAWNWVASSASTQSSPISGNLQPLRAQSSRTAFFSCLAVEGRFLSTNKTIPAASSVSSNRTHVLDAHLVHVSECSAGRCRMTKNTDVVTAVSIFYFRIKKLRAPTAASRACAVRCYSSSDDIVCAKLGNLTYRASLLCELG